MLYHVIPTKLFKKSFLAEDGILTYSSESEFLPGQIVSVPLGKSSTPGIILKKLKASSHSTDDLPFEIKSIIGPLYDTPLPSHILESILWLNHYYLTPVPTAANLFLPTGVTKKRRSSSSTPTLNPQTSLNSNSPTPIPLNPHQESALSSIESLSNHTKLLHGITGSGKTNIYLSLAKKTLDSKKSVILLVPEIALTSQIVQIFTSTFKDQVNLIHSNQTESYRHKNWENILKSKDPLIIIGPRSALLAPVQNLGLIIIDESHESTYFQENSPKYSTLRLASFMANYLKITCLQGSATPLISDFYLARHNNSLISLDKKAKKEALDPTIHIIDLKKRENFTKNRFFSDQLINQINLNLENHHQTIIFHNRRGSSPLTICEHCGWQALCPNCFLPLTLHTDAYKLLCHTCGYTTKVPTNCPSCGHLDIIHKGFGTKLLESELKKLFKNANIARFDSDNTKDQTISSHYDSLKSGKIDIILGTQSIAKGLDLPNLETVGIVQADSGLSIPDFASEERTFQLITQVIGRTGRGHLSSANVFIQTFQPDHPIINFATTVNYLGFFEYLKSKRQKSSLPPFTYLLTISITYKTEKTTIKKIQDLYLHIAKTSNIYVSRPTPAFHEQSSAGFTWQINIKAKSRAHLISIIKDLPPISNLKFTLDPPSLLQ